MWDGQAWMRMQNVIASIEEFEITRFNDNKIYDMMGRELRSAPIGQMYIRNRNVFFIVK